MSKQLQIGQKVEYLYDGKWRKGIIHGTKTHEEPSGIITKVAYLVDTGVTDREDVTKVHAKTGEVLETVKQPEQIEVGQDAIKAL